MPLEPNLAFRRSQRTGAKICVAAAVAAAAFSFGVLQGSYWALAVPVALGVMAVLWLAFWVGWSIATIDTVPAEAEPYESRFARHAGLAICAASLVLGLVFVAGVLQASYWALAVPVTVAVLGLLGMIFHIGWAIVTRRESLPEDAGSTETPADAAGSDEHSS